MFIDPDDKQIAAAIECGADAIELHTGAYAEAGLANDTAAQLAELQRIEQAVAADAVFIGLESAVTMMKEAMYK